MRLEKDNQITVSQYVWTSTQISSGANGWITSFRIANLLGSHIGKPSFQSRAKEIIDEDNKDNQWLINWPKRLFFVEKAYSNYADIFFAIESGVAELM